MLKKSLIISLTALLFFVGCNENDKQEAPKIETKIVKTLLLKNRENIKNWYEYPAEIYPYHNVNMAFEVSGKIVKFYYETGQRVKKGSVIAQLDDSIYKSNFKAMQANYNKALADYKRYENLYNSNVIAKNEFETAKQNFDVRKAQYDIAKKNLDNTKLIAEFDGIIAKKNVDDFARVMAKQSIVILQDNSKYKVKFSIPETDMLHSTTGARVEDVAKEVEIYVTLSADDAQKYKAKLIDVSTLAQNISRTYEITVLIDNPKDKNILPGMTAKVQARMKNKIAENKIFIPYKALFTDDSKNSFVWSVDENNRVSKVEVKTQRLENDQVLITEGLNGDERIVISGIHELKQGDRVQLYKKLGK